MKNLLLTLCLFAWAIVSTAQVKNIEYSLPFDEPVDSWNKLLQLKNGYTFLFKFDGKEGISLIVYNEERKTVSKKVLSSELWDPKSINKSIVEGIYEIDGQPVIFLHQTIKRVPLLYRIQLNPKTGAIVKQTKIGELKKYKFGAGYAMALGSVDAADFEIYKDPNSNSYIQVNYNSFASESNKRIEVVQYKVENGVHTEVNRSYYNSGEYKYIEIITALVDGDNCYVLTYGYNTNASGGKDTRVIMSKRSITDKDFKYNKIEFTDDFLSTRGIMKKNPEIGFIQLLTQTYIKKKGSRNTNYYAQLISYIDPESLQVTKTKLLSSEGLTGYIKKNIVNGEDYRGLAQDMIINKDNTTTFLSEEETVETVTYKSSVKYYTYLFNIGVTTLDYKGTPLNDVCIPKKHSLNGTVPDFYHNARQKGIRAIPNKNKNRGDRHFFSFDYINTSNNNSYIIYNDVFENLNEKDYKELYVFGRVSDGVTVYTKIDKDNTTSNYLYGIPNDDKKAFSAIETSSFKEDTYAVLMIKRNGRKKQAYIAWVNFE